MDRFDDIWKNRFNEGENLPEDFGTPDDSVWKEIEQSIEAKPKRKGWLWWLVGMGIFIILFAFLSSKAFNKPDIHFSDQSPSQPQLISALNEDFGKKNKERKINTEVVLPSEKTNRTVSINSKTKKERPSQKADNQFVINEVLVKEFVQTPNISANEMALSENVDEVFDDEKLTENLTSQSDLPQIPTLAILQNELSFLEFRSSIDLPNFSVAKVIEPIQTNSKFSVAPVVGGVFWRHRISEQYTSDLSDFEFNYSDEVGWTSGLKLGMSVGQYFEISTGLQFSQIEVASGHNSEIGYDPNLENGNNSNNYDDLVLATPYGLTPASFVLNRNSDVGSDEVPLKVDFFSGHTITNFSAPIEIKFSPYGKKRTWQPYVGIGAGFNYISRIQNQIKNIDTHHSAITFDQSTQSFSNSEIKKTFYDLRGSAGLGYHFSNKNQLNFNYSYARGLNAVFELQQYSTAIDQHYFTIELKRSF